MLYRQSLQQMKFGLTYRCAACGKRSWNVDFYDGQGRKLSPMILSAATLPALAGGINRATGTDLPDTEAEVAAIRSRCRKCGAEWPTFAIGVDYDPPAPVSETASGMAEAPAPGPLQILETHRDMEPMGDEIRRINNIASTSAAKRTITLERQWRKSVEITSETTTKFGGSGGLDFKGFGSLRLEAERGLKEHYAIQMETVQTYTDQVEIQVDAKKALEVVFHWFRIWQCGEVVLPDGKRLPFRAQVGLTFDQTQRDA